MPLTDLLTPEAVIPALKCNSKKQALQELAAHAATLIPDLTEREIYDTLVQRERLGSTGIGDGIAIPHGKPEKLNRVVGLFARAERPFDFDALDGQPVDLMFLLLAPENAGADHLKALARVARVLREPAMLERIRATRDPDALYALLTEANAQPAKAAEPAKAALA
ncbi:PTS IIA-like nitrogen regulatory protein PtsN [Camelimonas sp. ID_303_24]